MHTQFSDLELFSLIKEEDAVAYEILFKRYNYMLYIYAYNKLGDKEDAKDIVQDLFAAIWAKRKTLLFSTDNVSGYLQAAVRNRIFDLISKKKCYDKHLDELPHYIYKYNNENTDYLVRELETQAYIEGALTLLPPRMRLVFELSRKDGLSHKEIANRLQISTETVKDQIKKALKIVKKKLGVLTHLIWGWLIICF